MGQAKEVHNYLQSQGFKMRLSSPQSPRYPTISRQNSTDDGGGTDDGGQAAMVTTVRTLIPTTPPSCATPSCCICGLPAPNSKLSHHSDRSRTVSCSSSDGLLAGGLISRAPKTPL